MWVWVLEGKAVDPEGIGRQLARWADEFGHTAGYLGATAGVADDRRFLLLVRWESEDAGNELLMRPEQQAWYGEFLGSFDGEIAFAETDDVTIVLGGGSDSAGFVQAMKVDGVDRQRVEAADREFEGIARDMRPDLIGSFRVWTASDGFVEINYFTSEADARAGEQVQPPAELAKGFEDFMEMIKDAEFLDFTEPFLHSGTAA